jgi:hypothetical protein
LRWLFVSLVAVIGGCVTPVIPLPPPQISRVSFELTAAKDSVVFKGDPDPALRDAYVFVMNTRARTGEIVMGDPQNGSFKTRPIPAKDGDRFYLWASQGPYEPSGDVTCLVVDFTRGKQACTTGP